jgi:hypothetical protein
MSRVLYVAENCHQCALVGGWVREHTDIEIKNVDTGTERPPIQIFIYPALFENDGLKAYGDDIIPLLKRNLESEG